ncbi:MAG: hypothetical protein H6732_04675 [Alphaproteobacteria bacterium]|nr:hypothetical protein [Alphaproteobacteria bacterium]
MSRSASFLALLLSACTCSRDPTEGALADNVGEAFAACNEAEIRFLAAKHNVQLVFAPCGSNNFSSYRWAPDGTRIFFQLVLSANVMDANAADKRTITLPIPKPVGSPAWLGDTRVAVPVAAAEEGGDVRIALYEVPATPEPGDQAVGTLAGSAELIPLPGLVAADQLTRGEGAGELLFAGRRAADGPWEILRLDLGERAVSPAFPSVSGAFDTFTYAAEQGLVVLGHGDTVRVVDAATGEERDRWTPARRGSLDATGRWLLLEHAGSAISVFNQRTWGEISEQARKREEARGEAFAERLPEGMDRVVQPPTLSVADREGGGRWTFTAALGDGATWYPGSPGWISFFLWGFEGKQVKRNVALWDVSGHLAAIANGEERFALEPFEAPADDGEGPGEPAPDVE